jgi:transposase
MLGMIGAALRRPKPVVFGPWSKKRKLRRVQAIRAVVENLAKDEVAYYEDEVDIHLNPRLGPDWTLPGQRRYVITPGQNEKRYVAGALSIDGSDLIWVAGERKRSDLFMRLLDELRRRNPTARHIHLVLDNYMIHTSKITTKHVAKYGDLFRLHFLPPYSPDHNKIERFWKDLHDNVTRNHRCETMDSLSTRLAARPVGIAVQGSFLSFSIAIESYESTTYGRRRT